MVLVVGAVGGGLLVNAARTGSNRIEAVSAGGARYAVIFVIDGAGWRDLSRKGLPTIEELKRVGTQYKDAWAGTPVLSSAETNATLATGVFPREHGIQGLNWRDAMGVGPANVLAPQQVLLGSVDQALEASNVTPLASAIKDKYPTGKIVSVGGEGCAAASAAGTWIADYVLCPVRQGKFWTAGSVAGHEPAPGLLPTHRWNTRVATGRGLGPMTEGWHLGKQDDWIASIAASIMRQTRPRLTLVNFPEIESVAQWAPPRSRAAVVQQLMKGIDAGIDRILKSTKKWTGPNRTAYILTSDGAVNGISREVPISRLREGIAAAGGETTYFVGGPTASIGLRDQLQLDPAVQALESEQVNSVDMLFSKRQTRGQWSYALRWASSSSSSRTRAGVSALMQTLATSLSPDISVVPRPGAEIGKPLAGGLRRTTLFGGVSWPAERVPLIIAGDGTFGGQTSAFPARLVDVTPTLEYMMGLPSTATDGVVLADSLAAPTRRQIAHQTVRQRQVNGLVHYLQSWR